MQVSSVPKKSGVAGEQSGVCGPTRILIVIIDLTQTFPVSQFYIKIVDVYFKMNNSQ